MVDNIINIRDNKDASGLFLTQLAEYLQKYLLE